MVFSRRMWSRGVAALGCGALVSAALAGCSSSAPNSSASSSGPVTISLMAGGNDPAATKFATDLAAAFHKANPTITVKVDTRPAGTDGDNLIKTKLVHRDAWTTCSSTTPDRCSRPSTPTRR